MYVVLHRSGKNKQNVYVNLMESKRDDKGKVTKRIVQVLGRLDELTANDPHALEKLKQRYARDRTVTAQAKAQEQWEKVQEILSKPETEGDNATDIPALFYGHYLLKSLWENDFYLDQKLNYLRKKSKTKFDVNAAAQYMVFQKLLGPCSVLKAFQNKDNFLGDPTRDLTLDYFYEAYDFINKHHDAIFEWINKKLDGMYGKNRATLVFYDVTNAYFETTMTDAELELERSDLPEIVQELANEWLDAELLTAENFDDDGNVIAESLPAEFWESIDEEKLRYLRMRGPSKEHRFDLPLVSIALVIDRNGFPMDVAVYSGNSSEFKTMKASIEALKKKYNIKKSIVVADRGLNSLGNLTMLQDDGLGFLMAQKVSQFDSQLKAKMLDLKAYTPFNPAHPEAGGYRVIPNWKRTGCGQDPMKCTLVLTYDEKRKKRDEALLESFVDIVKAKQEKGVKLGRRKFGWAALAKVTDDADKEIIGVDEEVLKKKKELCGFAALVYKNAPDEEASDSKTAIKIPDLTGEQIATTYRTLNQIETCFRIMKSNLGLRPMYVRLAEHIKGHVDICVLALLFMRTMQKKLFDQGVEMSPAEISRTLNSMLVLPLVNADKTVTYASTRTASRWRKNREKWSTQKLLEKLREERDRGELNADKKTLMKIAGLEPLPQLSDRIRLGKCLGTRFFRDTNAIPEIPAMLMGLDTPTSE